MPGVTGFDAWPDFSAVEMDGYWFAEEAAAGACTYMTARSCGHSCGPARVVPSAVSGDGGASRMTQEGRRDGCYPALESLPGTRGRWPGIGGEWQA